MPENPMPPDQRPAPPRRHTPVWAVVLIVVGALIALVSLAITAGGGALTWAHATQRDANGFYSTPTERFETTTYAVTSDVIDLGRAGENGPLELGDLGTIRIRAEATGEQRVFVGIASQRDVDDYLASVSHATIEHLHLDPFSVEYRYSNGDRAARSSRGARHLGGLRRRRR